MPGSIIPLMQGMGQMTPAQQQTISKVYGRQGGVRSARRRKKKAAAARVARKRRSTKTKKRARMVKGSAAAKAYMAKIRRKRK